MIKRDRAHYHPFLLIYFVCIFFLLTGCNQRDTTEIEQSIADPPTELTEPIPNEKLEQQKKNNRFIHAEGTRLVDQNGDDFQIKGISYGNAVWTVPARISPYPDDTSYEEVARLGFNTVRFYLNYGFFEDDGNLLPGQYKQEGWDWLDQHFEWANQHGIRLILNMHFPQGGGQAEAGQPKELWENRNQEQERLISLWGAIADRYHDNETLIGYGLVNEPNVKWLGSGEESIQQWTNLAQQITNRIRESDLNHVIFQENTISAIENETLQRRYHLGEDFNFVPVDDPCNNQVFEFHYYTPIEYLNLNRDTVSDAPEAWKYPNEWVAMTFGYHWADTTTNSIMEGKASNGTWKTVLSKYFVLPEGINSFSAAVAVEALGQGAALFDDVVIEAYDPSTQATTEIFRWEFKNAANHWDNVFATGSGEASYLSSDGASSKGCLRITGDDYTSVNSISPVHFVGNSEYMYRISAMVKLTGASDETLAYPQFVQAQCDEVYPFDLSYLKASMLHYIAVGEKYQIPVWLGEFGANEGAFLDRGGELWVADVIKACSEVGIGYNFHLYEGGTFALYRDNYYEKPHTRNSLLYSVLEDAAETSHYSYDNTSRP